MKDKFIQSQQINPQKPFCIHFTTLITEIVPPFDHVIHKKVTQHAISPILPFACFISQKVLSK